MPLYEYFCDACKQTTEKLEKYSEQSVRNCEVCGSERSARRVISRTSFALDGSGWYKQAYTKG
jgi:putative FmdB family regulatory protein